MHTMVYFKFYEINTFKGIILQPTLTSLRYFILLEIIVVMADTRVISMLINGPPTYKTELQIQFIFHKYFKTIVIEI